MASPQGDRASGRRQLPDEVATYVRELVMSGQLVAGEFVRLEHIATQLGISQTPAREGLLSLRGEGFLILDPRKGFRVAPLTRQDVEDMFAVQELLAGIMAGRAARHATPELLSELEAVHTRMAELLGQNKADELHELNFDFHRLINRAAGSSKLRWLMGLAIRYAPRIFYDKIRGWPEASVRDHREILDALLSGDGEGSTQAMAEHIHHAGILLVEHLEAEGFWGPRPRVSVLGEIAKK